MNITEQKEAEKLDTDFRALRALHWEGLSKIAAEIKRAESDHRDRCLNGNTAWQQEAQTRADHFKQAFAYASGTAVGGLEFNAKLAAASITTRPTK